MATRLDTRRLDAILSGLDPRGEELIAATAHQVEGIAKTLAPVDTGALKNSLEATRQSRLLWEVHDGVEYGIFQELGHHTRSGSFVAAQPFLVPAVERVRAQFNKMWAELFK